MAVKHATTNGFTLIELLVSLVIATVLFTILLDGLISSKVRSVKQISQQRAVVLAENLLEQRRSARAAVAEINGKQDELNWKIQETIIAQDPRLQFALIQVSARAGPKSAPNLARLERRFVRALQ